MKIEESGEIKWVIGNQNKSMTPYRIKISRISTIDDDNLSQFGGIKRIPYTTRNTSMKIRDTSRQRNLSLDNTANEEVNTIDFIMGSD